MGTEIVDDNGPLQSDDRVYGRINGSSKSFSPDIIYDFIKTQTDTLYPTQAQHSSLDDYVNAFTLQKSASDNTKWDGESLIARGFAEATGPTDLVVYQQLQDAILATTFDIPGLTVIDSVHSTDDLLLVYDDSAGGYRSATPNQLISGLDPDLGAIAALSGTGIGARTASDTWALRSLTAPAAGLTITNPAGVAGDPTFVLANDLAAIEGLGSTGIAVRSASDTWVQRLLANASAGLTWTNADGVSGNPTPVFANDLGALEALSSTGIAVRTTTDTWAQRTITGTANEISIANGDGVSGNPTASLPSALTFTGKTITGGTFASPTAITGLPDPTGAQDAATKAYVDSLSAGLDVKPSVKCATTANITLSGEQTLDGILTSASRVLVKNQSTASQNGVYVSAAGAWTRATDMDAWAEVPGSFVFVEEGTLYADCAFVCTANAGGTLGSTSITWTQFAGAGTYTAGTGLTLTGTQFSVDATITATLSGSQALTNKSIDLASNTLTGTLAQFNTALTGADFASLAGAEALTNKTIALGSNTVSGSVAEFNTALTGADFYTTGGTDVAIADGGTGASSALAAFDALSPMTTRGDLITRGASNNARLAAGAANTILKSDGTDPSWATLTSLLDAIGATQGQILYRNSSAWVALGVGSSGQVLQSGGPAADVAWATVAGTGDVTAASGFGTDNSILRADGTSKGAQSSALTIADTSGTISGFANAAFLGDSSGNELLKWGVTASAVNEFTITNAATGNKPVLSATGGDTNIILQVKGKGTGGAEIQGTSTNDSAATGYVGEYTESSIALGSGIAMSTATNYDITSITLSAGDWDLWGSYTIELAGGATLTGWTGWASTTSATLPTKPAGGAYSEWRGSTTSGVQLPIGMRRYSVSGSTTVYLSARPIFTGGSTTGFGIICARRVR